MAVGKAVREARSRMTEAATAQGPASFGEGAGPTLLRVAAQERAINRGARRFFEQTDEQQLLQVALEVIASLVRVDAIAVFLRSDGDDAPRCWAVRCEDRQEMVPSGDAVADVFAADAMRARAPRQCDVWLPPGGDERCRSALAVPLQSENATLGAIVAGRHAPGSFRDDHVGLLNAVAGQLALALLGLRGEQLRAEFVSTASHEIRTPLAALQGFVELMLERQVSQDVQREWLKLMHHESMRLTHLVDQMREMARVEPGSVCLDMAPVHVGDIVSRVVGLLDSHGRRVRIVTERAPMVIADGDKLTQVLTNLVRNALDYSPSDRPVEVEVSQRCLARGGYALPALHDAGGPNSHARCRPAISVAVRDQGIGMTPEELRRICRPFYRAEASRELLPDGSGLGLSIAKTIVDRHRGRLWAESAAGEGSVFGFCLPAQEPSSEVGG